MGCKCFKEVKEKISEQIEAKLPEHTEFKGDWKNRVFFFGENPPCVPVVIPFEHSYRAVKTNGEPYKNKITNTMSVTMMYCPICGKATTEELEDGKENENS